MEIATILPTRHLWLEDGSEYHLCLAHQIVKDIGYAAFFRKQVNKGKFVILDNGAAENGVPMSLDDLLMCVSFIGCHEMVLPDTIGDSEATLNLSGEAALKIRKNDPIRLMAVPQGKSAGEWAACLKEMLTWDIDTIGISKFTVPGLFTSRAEALEALFYYHGSKDIHLLGYTGVPGEVQDIERRFPGKVRGIDSSIPTLYTQLGYKMDIGRPDVELDLDAELDQTLLRENIWRWKSLCSI